jgi:hypothetical protein
MLTDDRVNRSYALDAATVKRIKALVYTYQVSDSALVDFLLTYALDAIEAGRLMIQRRPATWKLVRD